MEFYGIRKNVGKNRRRPDILSEFGILSFKDTKKKLEKMVYGDAMMEDGTVPNDL